MGLVALLYGLLCYGAFLAAFLYLIAFVGDLDLARSLDAGPAGPMASACLLDAALVLVFALQHSLMARPGFKRAWARIVPAAVERSTYVLLASLALALLFWQWRPIPAVLWNVSPPLARGLIRAVFWAGVLTVLVSSCMISHADLFGLRQVWLRFRGQPPPAERPFRASALYAWVRHPLMSGFLLIFWATPTMTGGHLLFAAVTTGYIVVGTWLEERDLVAELGPVYLAYRTKVARFLPAPWRRKGGPDSG